MYDTFENFKICYCVTGCPLDVNWSLGLQKIVIKYYELGQ